MVAEKTLKSIEEINIRFYKKSLCPFLCHRATTDIFKCQKPLFLATIYHDLRITSGGIFQVKLIPLPPFTIIWLRI